MSTSRLPGFYKLSVDERRRIAAKELGLSATDLARRLDGGLAESLADDMIENVLGRYSLPFALGLNVQMNGKDYLVPMVVEEPSVVAAASNASKIVRAGGGFKAESDAPIMIAQVQLDEVPDAKRAEAAILSEKQSIMEMINLAVPGLVARGGGARDIEVRDLGDGMLVVHLLVDCRDAMGANLVNSAAEAVAEHITALAQGKIGLRILSNLADQRCVRVKVSIPTEALTIADHDGEKVRDGIIRASRFAEKDPYRATTHNKGIMNGIDAVVLATGNDWRAAEAGAHAYAARSGIYSPLCIWTQDEQGNLMGEQELPLALGTVGGPTRIHHGAQLALRMSDVGSAQELGMLAACVGVASNLAALRALATVGIQKGHMALHAKSVARAAGAEHHEVERIASIIHAAKDVTLAAAKNALARLRNGEPLRA